MEIFSPNYANAYGRAYPVTPEEYLQQSQEPQDRLTKKELQQLREIREEIESRPKLTRFEKRYIRLIKAFDQEFCGDTRNRIEEMLRIRDLLKELERTTTSEKRAILIAHICGSIARFKR